MQKEVKKDKNIHTSVLLHELLEHIPIYKDKQNIIVDATLGLAGHAKKILERMNSGDILIGFDADERNLILAKQILLEKQKEIPFGDTIRIVLIHSNFENLRQELEHHKITSITGIYYDLGVSSLHFDEAKRGFSFRQNGPLDMRMDERLKSSAADILNFYEEKDLYEILKTYGEEPFARKIAEKIIIARKKKKFETSDDLNHFLEQEINAHIKTKMRVYQALRIEVNKELDVLEKSLEQAVDILEKQGRIFVISFHSLEDRIVKHFFQKESRDCICHDIICTCKHTKTLKIISKKPIIPSQEEQQQNSRSRSAKARCAEKI